MTLLCIFTTLYQICSFIERKKDFRDARKKFLQDYLSSLSIGAKVGGIALIASIALYLIAKFAFRWDLFYETDLNYTLIFLLITIIFIVIVVLCIFVAIILFNTKHKRNTKYEEFSR